MKMNGDNNFNIANVDVEIVQLKRSNIDKEVLERHVDEWLRRREYVTNGEVLRQFTEDERDRFLTEHVDYVKVCEDRSVAATHLPSVSITYHVYKLVTLGPETEEICQEGEEEIPAAQHWVLPNSEFQGVWENLIYDTDIKNELIKFVGTSLLLSDKGVDSCIVTCNR